MIANKLIQKESPYRHLEYLDSESGNRLRVVPERGGLITEWRCNGKEILYFDLDRFQLSGKSVRGGIPILFPICGDLPGGFLPLVNGNFPIKQHGFARDMPWSINSLEKQTGISLKLSQSLQTLTSFPFDFSIEIKAILEIDALNINIYVHNLGEETMPFSFGLHPYFRVSSLANISISGLAEKCINHQDMAIHSTEKQLANIQEGIDLLSKSKDNGLVEMIDLNTFEGIEMQSTYPMDLVVVWTEPHRKMVCLEPWTSPRNSLISGERKLLLQSGETMEFGCKYISKRMIRHDK
tara:strand:+ start:13570 stop:14454 length:885 start_codon:yes stop_codon:yes gene_type:complete